MVDSSSIDKHSKSSAFSFLYKYYPKFSKNSRVSEHLNQFPLCFCLIVCLACVNF